MQQSRNSQVWRTDQDCWYRNPMVWLVIVMPSSVVLAALLTIVIAVQHAPILLNDTSKQDASTVQRATASVRASRNVGD